jgi:hypothetical protein
MNTATALRNEGPRRAPRARAFFEDWMLQLVLVIAVVAALIDCALSLNGSSLV